MAGPGKTISGAMTTSSQRNPAQVASITKKLKFSLKFYPAMALPAVSSDWLRRCSSAFIGTTNRPPMAQISSACGTPAEPHLSNNVHL